MKLFKYQGAPAGSAPGDIVELEALPGVLWTVTEQGHLVSEASSDEAIAAAHELVAAGFVQEET